MRKMSKLGWGEGDITVIYNVTLSVYLFTLVLSCFFVSIKIVFVLSFLSNCIRVFIIFWFHRCSYLDFLIENIKKLLIKKKKKRFFEGQ